MRTQLAPIYHPEINFEPVRNHGGPMREHLGLVLHVQVGLNSLHERFDTPSTEVSSTWWISKTGVIECYVNEAMEAWAQAEGNATYNSVETEGGWDPVHGRPDPNDPLTLLQCAGLAYLLRLGHTAFDWPYKVVNRVGRRGLIWHGAGGNAWGGHPDCPGDVRKEQRKFIVAMAAAKPITVPQSPKPEYAKLRQEVDLLKANHGLPRNGRIGVDVRHLLGL